MDRFTGRIRRIQVSISRRFINLLLFFLAWSQGKNTVAWLLFIIIIIIIIIMIIIIIIIIIIMIIIIIIIIIIIHCSYHCHYYYLINPATCYEGDDSHRLP